MPFFDFLNNPNMHDKYPLIDDEGEYDDEKMYPYFLYTIFIFNKDSFFIIIPRKT